MDILKNIGRKKRTLMNSPLQYQAMLDNAPVGSVGAPSGVLPNAKRTQYRDPAESLLRGLSLAPVVGDIAGPLADIRRFQNDPESRTLGNAAMFALGALPAIPSLAFLMSQGGKAAKKITPFSKEAGIIGYHGSPHKFDAFDMSKIGTGEGAQAYGHGLYFAESPEVAKSYQTALSAERGFLYTVDIPDEHIDKMLDWDKPLSEQPEAVRKAVMPLIEKEVAQSPYSGGWGDLEPNPSSVVELKSRAGTPLGLYSVDDARALNIPGSAVIKALGMGDKESRRAAELLRQAGIPGIKYLDAGSRGAGNGTRNFVLFDDKIPKILKRE